MPEEIIVEGKELPLEVRLHNIDRHLNDSGSAYAQVLALIEIARQLGRIADKLDAITGESVLFVDNTR